MRYLFTVLSHVTVLTSNLSGAESANERKFFVALLYMRVDRLTAHALVEMSSSLL